MRFKILDLYLAKKFLGAVFFMLLFTAVISIVFDISEKIENFLQHKLSFGVILDYYVAFVPNIINIVSPLVIFLAALYFTSRLANNSEMLAILSSGVSYYRMIVPYIAVSVLLCLVDMGLKNFVTPHAYAAVTDFDIRYVEKSYDFEGKNVHRQLDQNTFFYAYAIQYKEHIAVRFALERFKDGNLVYRLRGSEAKYDSVKGSWMVKNYFIREINGMHEKITTGDSMRVKIPLSMADFSQKVRNAPAMNTPELNRYIEEEQIKGEGYINFYLIEKYKRFAMPIDIIVLVMIAVAVSTRKVRGGFGMHLLIGILIAVAHELFERFSTTFSTNADFPPLLAVFLPTIVFGIVAVYLLKTTPK